MARTRALDYDVKRLAILHHAAELFALHGVTGTTVTMIAEACDVSPALLYHYYESKEAVLYAILSSHLGRLIEIAERAAAAPGDARERLGGFVQAILDAYRDADAEHQVQIASLKLLPAAQQDTLRQMERRLVDLLSAALADAVPDIGHGPLLKPLTMSLFGMLNWHYLWFRDGKGLTRAEYARLVTVLVVEGAGAARRALDPSCADA